ncbi:uncharacterized protein LOC134540781 [Bacillus rossius redtenbacheri]|uniref:uncharacterized protein LOC134540781 n=1 Tax=Bacillus rossius redtenbacheri TaxID=93214 RepID=UPI002FDC9676
MHLADKHAERKNSTSKTSCYLLADASSMPLRDLGLRRLWGAARKSGSSDSRTEDDSDAEQRAAACSLPLLQVWPSQDSPRGEGDGQCFVFHAEEGGGPQHDSGIESVQVSPSPGATHCTAPSPSPPLASRRASSSLLHPDHARLPRLPPSPEHAVPEDAPSCSSSTTSSMTSVAMALDRRRSSAMTTRYSLLDALDLEYALLRAAARGSIGPYSLSESVHKLTFTQSLAFPALARAMAGKRRRSSAERPRGSSAPDPRGGDSGMNAFAKIVTALVLVLVSVLVFAVVYKFVKT